MRAAGTLSLDIGDEAVGQGRIVTQPGNVSLVGEGVNVGKDPGEPATSDGGGGDPFRFTGGTIARAVVVSGAQHADPELEALAMTKRE